MEEILDDSDSTSSQLSERPDHPAKPKSKKKTNTIDNTHEESEDSELEDFSPATRKSKTPIIDLGGKKKRYQKLILMTVNLLAFCQLLNCKRKCVKQQMISLKQVEAVDVVEVFKLLVEQEVEEKLLEKLGGEENQPEVVAQKNHLFTKTCSDLFFNQ